MVEFITLLGADDVRQAGSARKSAACEMRNAAASIEDSLQRHKQFLDDWLCRLEAVMKEGNKSDA